MALAALNAFQIKNTLVALENLFRKNGFRDVEIGEPKAPPKSKLSIRVWMDNPRVVTMFLDRPREVHSVTIRIYKDMINIPESVIEQEMATNVSIIMNLLYSNVNLDNTISEIDIGGIYGKQIEAKFGHAKVGNLLYRICDIDVPFIVDTVTTFTRG